MTVLASDGLKARLAGRWTKDKLYYVGRYAQAFMTAMAPKKAQGKWDALVYLDMLCGPGKCIERDSGSEFNGSPLLALQTQPPFDRLYFTDSDSENIEALEKRIAHKDRDRVEIRVGDCNALVGRIVSKISPKMLGLAFLDPEGLEVQFQTLKVLATRRIDILYLFPSGIGIARNLHAFVEKEETVMDAFWGGPDWRKLHPAELAAGKPVTLKDAPHGRPWVRAFRKEMEKLGFLCPSDGEPIIENDQRAQMYHLLFFTRHEAGLQIWRGIKQIEASGQRKLPLKPSTP